MAKKVRAKALLAPSASIIKVDFEALRFWSKVDKSGGPNACWNWTDSVAPNAPYGQFRTTSPKTGKRTMRRASVMAWELSRNQRAPEGKCVLHSQACGTNKLCCNPKHLRIGTHKENSADAKALGLLKGRKLNRASVLEIVALKDEGWKNPELAEKFGVSPDAIMKVCNGRTWSKVTGIVFCRKPPGRPRKVAKVSTARKSREAYQPGAVA
jgi:hypothetical protein